MPGGWRCHRGTRRHGRILSHRRAISDEQDLRLDGHLGRNQWRMGPDHPGDPGAADSRYAKIMLVMRESEEKRPQLRRLGDRLGAIYTPIAVTVAILAWVLSGQAIRFLAVLVIATPCPLLLAIPIAIIGSISLCARRAIIIKSPVVLEQIAECRTAIFDKTGTLTYGEPRLTEQLVARGFARDEVLTLVASLERYSKHPLARAILAAARKKGSNSRRPPKLANSQARVCSEPFPLIKYKSRVAAGSLSKKPQAPTSFLLALVGSSAWWRSTTAMRRSCDFVMPHERRVAPSSSTFAPGTSSIGS